MMANAKEVSIWSMQRVHDRRNDVLNKVRLSSQGKRVADDSRIVYVSDALHILMVFGVDMVESRQCHCARRLAYTYYGVRVGGFVTMTCHLHSISVRVPNSPISDFYEVA